MGLKIFEYLASKTAIVASDMPLNKEFFYDGKNAILFTADDPKALVQAIKTVFSNSKLAKKISKSALKDSQNYSYENRARKIISFLNE